MSDPHLAPRSEDSSVQETIRMFESMLEVFPEDINALESLVDAYQQTGDTEKLCERGHRLLQLVSSAGDWPKVASVASLILDHQPDDLNAVNAMDQAKAYLGDDYVVEKRAAPGAAPADTGKPAGKRRTAPSEPLTFDLRGELDMAYFLLTADVINQQQYEAAIDRLTESSLNTAGENPLSLLQEFREMERIDLDRVVDFLAAEAGLPYVDLSRCDPQEPAYSLMPVMLSKRLGILPFDTLGDDLMVAVLNPVSKELRERVKRHFGGNLHFFFTSPDEFGGAITKILEVQKRA